MLLEQPISRNTWNKRKMKTSEIKIFFNSSITHLFSSFLWSSLTDTSEQLKKGLEHISEAVKADQEHDYEKALHSYNQGIDLLKTVLMCKDKNFYNNH